MRHNTLSLRHTLRRERIRHVRTNDLLSKRREGPPHSTKYLISERLRSEPKTHQESVRRERPSAEQHALAVAHTHANSLSHGERECQTRATFSRGGARGSHFQQNTSSKGEWSGAIKRVRRHQGSVVPSRCSGSAASRVRGGEL